MQSKKAFFGFQESPITHFPCVISCSWPPWESGLLRVSEHIVLVPPWWWTSLAMITSLCVLRIIRVDSDGIWRRKPAWTDRILYMHSPACRVNQLSYASHPQIMMSDHRPVSADFSVDVSVSQIPCWIYFFKTFSYFQVDVYDPTVLYTNVRNLFNDVERLDGESTHEKGGLRVVDTYVDFEKVLWVAPSSLLNTNLPLCVSYGVPVERKVTVKNMSKVCLVFGCKPKIKELGQGPCAFRFVPIQLDSPIRKWTTSRW